MELEEVENGIVVTSLGRLRGKQGWERQSTGTKATDREEQEVQGFDNTMTTDDNNILYISKMLGGTILNICTTKK